MDQFIEQILKISAIAFTTWPEGMRLLPPRSVVEAQQNLTHGGRASWLHH